MMKLPWQKLKPEFDSSHLEKLFRRAKRLGTDELIDQIDLLLSLLCRYVPEFRSTRDAAFLGEIRMTNTAMFVLTSELLDRQRESAAMSEELGATVAAAPQVQPRLRVKELVQIESHPRRTRSRSGRPY